MAFMELQARPRKEWGQKLDRERQEMAATDADIIFITLHKTCSVDAPPSDSLPRLHTRKRSPKPRRLSVYKISQDGRQR